MTDDFQGDTPHLIRCIESLLALDAKGVLVPHGVGGHARALLSASAVRLAALSEGQAQPVAIKPLEWLDNAIDGFVAGCAFGEYEITPVGYMDAGEWELTNSVVRVGYFPTIETAKAAAQQDYETRIRSALSAPVADAIARATAAEATVTALQEALEPFANSDMAPDTYDDDSFVAGSCDFTCGDVRRARAALSQIRSEK